MIKEHIIKASIELFMQYGVKNTTMDDIAKHAGISKRTIYENFKNKENLLSDGLNRFCEESRAFEQVLANTSNVVEAIVIMLKKDTEECRKLHYFIVEDIRKYAPEVYQNLLSVHKAEGQKRIEDLVKKGIQEGVFRNDLNPEIVAAVFACQSEGISTNSRKFDKFSCFELFENMILLYLRGLCTPKGVEILDQTLSKKSVNE
ncbi:MAG: TetR/AcrR family transcriptional regulator [Bacteroidales bacterium]|nr:TetR/AcrR family transcriptional regulator [Bacteroidales bacterium]